MSSHPVVIKLGGAALVDKAALKLVLQRVGALSRSRPCVLVHGGGELVDSWLQQWQRPVLKQHGLRLTPALDMPIVAGALAGAVNTELVIAAQQSGIRACGLSLADDSWCSLQVDEQRGAVGTPDPSRSSPELLKLLLTAGIMPVVCSIGSDHQGQRLNVNADLAAACVAAILQAELLLLTDVAAILTADGEIVASVDEAQAQQLIANNTVHGGMRIKLEAALQAARLSRRTTAVAAWASTDPLTAILAGSAPATRIHV
ncbi:acetylglutamate kinase [Aliidiomarina sp. Khilg15.8]